MSSSSSSASQTQHPAGKRLVRIRKPERDAERRQQPPENPPCRLAPDSLGYSLLLAARVLAAVLAGRSLTDALGQVSGEPTGARAAAQDVAYGVLRCHGRGEFILGRLMEKPLTHAETHALLLAALYRLETRPDAEHTVVDQAVAAAGELAGGALKGVVNGVLRNFLRRRETLLAEMASDDVASHQHPAWWLSRLRRGYRDGWQGIVDAGNSAPPMTLRVNTRKVSVVDYRASLEAADIGAEAVGSAGLILARPVAVDELPGFAQGWVSVQDAGAQRAAELLDAAPGARILDACAAPGGKTAHLLERADVDVVALDIDAARTRRIEDNLRRLGLTARVKTADCLAVGQWWDGRPFDAILADVPCSASGVVRRHPDIKALRRESDIRRLVHTQAAILDALWPLLKSGGKMLYATCSVFIEENSAQIDAFLVRQPDARRIVQEVLLPGEKNDGFYYALLQKV